MWDDRRDANGMGTPGDARLEAELRAFHAHWDACRKGRDVPNRSDIDPRRIAPLLSSTFIVERIAPGVVRLRLAGMDLGDLMGMDVRGMPLCSFIAPESRAEFARHLVDLFDGPAIARLALRSRASIGRPALAGTMLLLPLRSDLGDISRALGCLVTHGPIGRPARRFDIESVSVQPLSATTKPAALTVIAGTGTRTAATNAARLRGHLRIVS